MAELYLRVTVSDWRDVGYDERGNRLSDIEDRHVRGKIIQDLVDHAKYEIERRAEDRHDVVVKVEEADVE